MKTTKFRVGDRVTVTVVDPPHPMARVGESGRIIAIHLEFDQPFIIDFGGRCGWVNKVKAYVNPDVEFHKKHEK